MLISDIILICSIFLIAYNYIVYPILLIALNKIIKNPYSKDYNFKPNITFIIAAHNEEELIGGAINSILASDYTQDKIKILVGSDGSTDRTDDILEEYQQMLNGKLQYFKYTRSGKNKVLNDLLPKSDTDIVLFMDADCRVSSNTISEMVANFFDDNIACVIASQSVESENNDNNAGKLGDTAYHRYEQVIRELESNIHSNVNSLGYLYAVKKIYLKPIPNDFVCDDLHNVYSIIEYKKRVIFEKNAQAKEIRKKSFSNELHRRVRAVAGGIATMVEFSHLANIFKYGIVSFFLISHKVFRWLSPFFIMLLIFLTFTFWNSSYLWLVLFYGQLLFYFVALLGWIADRLNINIKFAKICLFVISMNYSSLLGTIRYLKKSQNAIWDRIGFSGD
ncbi:MAG TPA: glycosyltransferase [Candidatus Kapabacteria bacterium]|nr:glycosyltransferase [Candidatus Kapabacteria bacterium]